MPILVAISVGKAFHAEGGFELGFDFIHYRTRRFGHGGISPAVFTAEFESDLLAVEINTAMPALCPISCLGLHQIVRLLCRDSRRTALVARRLGRPTHTVKRVLTRVRAVVGVGVWTSPAFIDI